LNKAEFENIMEEIDEILKEKNVPFHARSFHALSELAKKLKQNIIITPLKGTAIANVYEGVSLSRHVMDWYREKYGDKLKINITQGTSVILIKKDPYKIIFPFFRGTLNLVCDRNLKKYKRVEPITIKKNEKLIDNCLNYIEELTQYQADRLTDDELHNIHKYINDTFNTLFLIEDISNQKYVKEALTDLNLSVDLIFSKNKQLGMSKYSSMQFFEKIIKAYISLHNEKEFKIHKLNELTNKAIEYGLSPLPIELIDKVKCSAEPRYNKNIVTLEEAVEAHHASLELSKKVAQVILERFKNE